MLSSNHVYQVKLEKRHYYNGSFVHTKKKLVEQAQKALYAVYYKIRNLQLPIDLQLTIFDSLVIVWE